MSSDEEIIGSFDGDYFNSDADGGSDAADYELIDDDEDNVDIGYASDDHAVIRPEKNYEVLRDSDIKQRQKESILHVSAVLSIPRVAATILLCYYRWNVSRLHDAWFADEERVRKDVGLLSKPIVQPKTAKKLTCGICFDSFSPAKIRSAACGHPYCTTCWKGYVTTSINDGPGCLLLRCPDPSCRAAVDQDMIIDLASNEDKNKFSRYLVRSYIEDKKKAKWCPAPDCENAVLFDLGSNIYDVTCLCSHAFCWNCAEEAHRPVDCSTVNKWILKNSAEAENVNWILANSKPCPKCRRPIEKNHGCMHMTCTPPCKFQFCWLCLGDWTIHGEQTGGSFSCNRYETAKALGLYDEVEKRREIARNSMERYTHYFERWQSNQRSKVKAIQDLHKMRTVHLEKLSDHLKESESQLKFIIEAWQQIIECRRVLKWTYAYGYYLPEKEHAKEQLFVYLQGEAEAGLERLHKCAEKDLAEYLSDKLWNEDKKAQARKNFISFRSKLTGLTRVTHSYFENLVKALESGLADVKSQASCSTSKKGGNCSTSKKGGKRGRKRKAASQYHRNSDPWNCARCTYENPCTVLLCLMCEGQRF